MVATLQEVKKLDWTEQCSAVFFVDAIARDDSLYYLYVQGPVPKLMEEVVYDGEKSGFCMKLYNPYAKGLKNMFCTRKIAFDKLVFKSNNIYFIIKLLESAKFKKCNIDAGLLRDWINI